MASKGFYILYKPHRFALAPNAQLVNIKGLPPGTIFKNKIESGDYCLYDVRTGRSVTGAWKQLKEAVAQLENEILPLLKEKGIDYLSLSLKEEKAPTVGGQLDLFAA